MTTLGLGLLGVVLIFIGSWLNVFLGIALGAIVGIVTVVYIVAADAVRWLTGDSDVL